MPGVSGVGDVEFSADEEGDRRRAAADDLVRLFVAKDQSEDEITNDVQSGRLVTRKVLKTRIWGVPRLVGRYCSYLLPKQAGGTFQILIFKTLRMIGRPALYIYNTIV